MRKVQLVTQYTIFISTCKHMFLDLIYRVGYIFDGLRSFQLRLYCNESFVINRYLIYGVQGRIRSVLTLSEV